MDEVHVAGVIRSPEWILTEYRNQNDPSSFYSVFAQPVGLSFKKDIVIDHTKVDADLTDFPMLIDIYDTDLKTKVQADGDDIVFSLDGWVVPYEIELFDQSFNSSHAHLVAWVKTDLSSTVDTTVSMYYGNPTIESQEYPAGVWNNGFVAVHHMEESPVGNLQDSTNNQQDLVTEGSMTAGDLIDAQIGKGIDFDDIDDGAVSISTVTINNFTISAWIKHYGADNWDTILTIGNAWGDVRYFGLENNVLIIDDYADSYGFGSALSADTWYHLVVTWDGSVTTGYIDGSYVNDYSESWGEITYRFAIGGFPWDDNYQLTDYWDGVLDEIRISNAPRSAGWIATEYNNQYDSSSFYSIGEETILAPIEFTYKRDIVVDSTKVDADLTDF
ncbi:MAG: LamG-like jellyroll fold domain-containing protein, partial [Candidatus Thorarchaeota archaeon]